MYPLFNILTPYHLSCQVSNKKLHEDPLRPRRSLFAPAFADAFEFTRVGSVEDTLQARESPMLVRWNGAMIWRELAQIERRAVGSHDWKCSLQRSSPQGFFMCKISKKKKKNMKKYKCPLSPAFAPFRPLSPAFEKNDFNIIVSENSYNP